MADLPADPLAPECEILTRYLTGRPDTAELREAYRRGHGSMPGSRLPPPDAFDRLLVWLARRHPFCTGAADGYARIFRPHGLLRQKLVLLLALVEHSGDYADAVEPAITSSAAVAWLGIVAQGLGWGLRLIAAALLLGPLHLVLRIAGPRHA